MSRRSSRSRRSQRATLADPRAILLPIFVASAIVLGGASAAGALANLLLQLIGIGIAWLTVIAPRRRPFDSGERWLVVIGVAFVALALAQLIPLPPGVWSGFPGREPIVREFQLLGAAAPWLPLSLNSAATVASVLAMTVVAGAFAATRRAGPGTLATFAWVIVVMAALSALLGFLQLVSGEHSPLYFYTITNRGDPVGFFSNSNHLATLELMSIPMVAALAARRRGGDQGGGGQAGSLVILGALGVLILLGLVTNGSVAGLVLLLPTLVACFLLFRGGRSRKIALITFGVIVVLIAAFVLLALNSPLLQGFAQTSLDAGPTSRLTFWRTTVVAIATYFPLGSGLGTFTTVFPSFENPATVSSVFINHAHNDYLEIVLELGAAGIAMILAFLGWWVSRVVMIWRARDSSALARAATITTAVVLAHSLADYPMRTAAVAVIFTACCAIMARSTRQVSLPPVIADDAPPARHLSA